MNARNLRLIPALLLHPLLAVADNGGAGHKAPLDDAKVDFGVIPLPAGQPLGPPPCQQTTGIGGPTDPCSYKLHHLTPVETTVAKGGQVTFQIHGGGHGFAIYPVDKGTTRNEIGQFLCPGADPANQPDPTKLNCNLSDVNAKSEHTVRDLDDDVVLVASSNPENTNTHPLNRVWYEPGRLMSVGGQQFLNGGTTDSNGQLVTYRFLKTGRYLVICMNRTHFLNDWMFGFVNVLGSN